MAIKTIFFDIGGVLLTNGFDRHQRQRVLSSLGVDVAEYDARHEDANYYWERGLENVHWYFGQTLFNEPRNFTFDDVWAKVQAEQKLIDNTAMEVLKKLSATKRYRLATLNNESRELNAYRLDAFGLREHFDFFICSAYVNEMKPAPKIYREAIEVSGRRPEECAFIDDKLENAEAATQQGMHGIHYTSAEQLEAELRMLGVVL